MRKTQVWSRYLLLFGLAFAAPLSIGGCQMSCGADNDVKDVVDEIGDEVEDVAEKLAD